jgi:hypothetical protein
MTNTNSTRRPSQEPRTPLRLVRVSAIATKLLPDGLWKSFPHCTGCDTRLYAATTWRHPRDPRGPLKFPTADGRCPHCGRRLYDVPSAEADAMAAMVRAVTE